eukprot:85787_1
MILLIDRVDIMDAIRLVIVAFTQHTKDPLRDEEEGMIAEKERETEDSPRKQSNKDDTKLKKKTDEKWTVTHPQKMIRVASRSNSTLRTTKSSIIESEPKSEPEELRAPNKPYILTIDSVATLPEVVADSAHKESVSVDNTLNIANLYPDSLSTVGIGSLVGSLFSDSSGLKYEVKDEVILESCADCKTYKLGRIYDGDGLFYCDDCWKNYYGSKRIV